MNNFYGDSVLEFRTSIKDDSTIKVLVSPQGGNSDPSALLRSIFRAFQAVTVTKGDNEATWGKSIASVLGFVSLNYPHNSAYCSTSFIVPSDNDVLSTGRECFHFTVTPTDWMNDGDLANPLCYLVEIKNIKTGKVVFSGNPTLSSIKELENQYSIPISFV